MRAWGKQRLLRPESRSRYVVPACRTTDQASSVFSTRSSVRVIPDGASVGPGGRAGTIGAETCRVNDPGTEWGRWLTRIRYELALPARNVTPACPLASEASQRTRLSWER